MASSSPAPPSSPPHNKMLALSLSLGASQPRPAARAPPSSSPRPRKKPRVALQADGTPFPRVQPSPTTGDAPPAPCKLCGKQFRSDKAVQGHMRMHSDRPYRGMTAPPEFVAAASEFDEPRLDGIDLLLAAANHVDMLQEIGGASASSPVATSSECSYHMCVFCGRQWFPAGQAQYGEGSGSVLSSSEETTAATATTAQLDLNQPLPGQPSP